VAILDTDVVSMLLKGDSRAVHYLPHPIGRLFGISFINLADGWSIELVGERPARSDSQSC